MLFLGLRTAIYRVNDIALAKDWYTRALGLAPYFDQPFYVGFSVGGYELGLSPDASDAEMGPGGSVPYWGVIDIEAALRHLVSIGAKERSAIQDVGDEIRLAVVSDPFGNSFGIIQNPHFKAD